MNHAFALPAEAGPHFTDPGGMEGWVDLVGWLHNWMVYPFEYSHLSKYQPGRALICFIDQTKHTLTTTPHCQLLVMHATIGIGINLLQMLPTF